MAARTKLIIPLVLFVSLQALVACGVKGKPLPPLDKTFIGNGQPVINKKTTEEKP